MPRSSSASPDAVQLQHGRYRIGQVLGEGGMAVVYQAVDLSTGSKLALKRLRKEVGDKGAAFAALFEREFLALSQLKHPRIVEVYDYHVDEDGPYYTMELLEGGDLQRIAPVDYRSACALAYDVCSALSLVHSRRLVFRDLSPNNVRRTTEGQAKLIDFGALAPIGPSREIVGTLPCVAPEAIGFAPLDGRTDLFALGATLYFALVRRHAYPARNVEELVAAWRRPPSKPSELVGGIPPALDQLVLELLQLDPERRPSTASEVMERLSAIAGLCPDEHLLVKQAYLATPALVGRDGNLDAVRASAARAKEGFGSSLSLQGPPGIGRSRMLEASGLEAKRVGMLVLRADARDAQQGDYGVVRALARGLLTQAPRLAKRLAKPHQRQLARIIDELREQGAHESSEPTPLQDPQDLHRQVQPILRQWFCEVAAEYPLALVVDGLERVDPPSAAFIGLMAREVTRHPILLITGQTSGAPLGAALQGALHIYARFSTALVLDGLDLELTQKLLGSLFGEVPNVPLLAQHVHRITKGNPRDVMRIAEHLVNENVIQYHSGAWSLPERLSARDLPSTMAQALELRTARLTPAARLLCYGLACEPSWAFRFEECARILQELGAGDVMKCLNELVASEFIEHASGAYSVAQSTLGTSLGHGESAQALRGVHLNLGAVCEERLDMFRSAQHLLRAGQSERGLHVLVEFALESVKQTDANPQTFHETLKSLPPDWLDTIDRGIVLCDQTRRPAREQRALLNRFSGLAAQAGPQLRAFPYLRMLVDQLSQDVGLDFFAELPTTDDPKTRIQTALGRATARYRARPEEERVCDPGAAISELAKAITAAIGVIAFSSSYADWQQLPSLAPLAPLSPTLALVQSLVDGMGLRISGHSEAAVAVYGKLLERLAQPDRGGLPASHHRHMQVRVMGAVAALEAGMGRSSSLDWAAKIAEEPRFESMALLIEQLYRLFQGDLREARRAKQRLELLRLESNAHHASEAQHMFLELAAYTLAQDMTGVKRALAALAPCEALHEGFRAAAHFGRSEYHRMRGDARRALGEIEAALGLMQAGQHLLWAHAASAHLRVLLELDRVDQACALGQTYARAASGLGYTRNHVRAALSLALLRRGEHEAAGLLVDQAIDELRALGSTGLNLAIVYEARAQIASAAGDQDAYERYAALFAEQWPGKTRGLPNRAGALDQPVSQGGLQTEEEALAQLKSTWETCHTVGERVHAGLELLARHMGALGGVLFTRAEEGLVRTASYGESAKDTCLDAWATDYFTREVTQYVTEDVTSQATSPAPTSSPPPAPARASVPAMAGYAPVLLGHNDSQGYALTGVVVLVGSAPDRPGQPATVAAELSRCVSELDHVVTDYL